MAVGDILQSRIETSFGTQSSQNIRHWRVSAEVAPAATHAQIAANLDTSIAPLYKAVLSTSATYRGVAVRRIFPLPPTIEAIANANLGAGTIAGDPLPKQTAGVVTFRTALAGRKFRGRFYAAFPAESDNNASTLPSNAYVAGLALLGGVFTLSRTIPNGAGSTTIDPVIWHRRTSTFDVITNIVARTIWGTQRRRGDYGRPNPPMIV